MMYTSYMNLELTIHQLLQKCQERSEEEEPRNSSWIYISVIDQLCYVFWNNISNEPRLIIHSRPDESFHMDGNFDPWHS